MCGVFAGKRYGSICLIHALRGGFGYRRRMDLGLGYAGPRKDDFVRIVTDLKEKDLQEAGYLYEPGEADPRQPLLSR